MANYKRVMVVNHYVNQLIEANMPLRFNLRSGVILFEVLAKLTRKSCTGASHLSFENPESLQYYFFQFDPSSVTWYKV